MRTLYELPASPWSERARWALDHHRLDYRRREHLVLFGDPLLRWRTGSRSVPALVDDGVAVVGSGAIARHADAIGSGAPLFPPELLDDIEHWASLTETALQDARAAFFVRLAADPEAKAESAPFWLARPLVGVGVGWLRRKYASDDRLEGAEARFRAVLDELRGALRGGTVLGAFTFADICAAAMLQLVRPVQHEAIELTPALRRVWTWPEVAEGAEDVVAWRDELYARHRTGSSAS